MWHQERGLQRSLQEEQNKTAYDIAQQIATSNILFFLDNAWSDENGGREKKMKLNDPWLFWQ